jgi:hypothetical protein
LPDSSKFHRRFDGICARQQAVLTSISSTSLVKKILLVALPLLILVVWVGWRVVDFRESVAEVAAPPVVWKGPRPTEVVVDPVEIFKRAFWRIPHASDEILHAERHEWSDAEGLLRWQWFIVVNASPELVKYLRDDNAFGLRVAETAEIPEESPAWFHFEPGEVSVMRSAQSEMQLVFSKTGNTLYASASGRGFTRGEPEPEPVSREAMPAGRLPVTPPPPNQR